MTTEIAEYSKTEAALSDLAQKYKGVVFDVRTREGLTSAKHGRAEIRKYRTSLEDLRKAIKEPALRRCQVIDTEARRITGELLALENPIDEQIAKEEERKEFERTAAIRAEQERLAAEEKARKNAEEKRLSEERSAIERERAKLDAEKREREEIERQARLKLEADERAARERIEAAERAARIKREDEDRKATVARQAEVDRLRAESNAAQAAISEIQGIEQQVIIAQTGRLGVRAGGTIACIKETLAETEAWPITHEHFGKFAERAANAKAIAVASIRALLSAAVSREAEEVRQHSEREALDKGRREQEERERAKRAAIEAKARAAREAEEAKQREIRRQENDKTDGREMLELFVQRYGHIIEFAAIVKAIKAYQNGS